MRQSCACLLGCMHKVGGANKGSVDQGGGSGPLSTLWTHPLWWGGYTLGVEWLCAENSTLARRFDLL